MKPAYSLFEKSILIVDYNAVSRETRMVMNSVLIQVMLK
jgi:hypothetical protein